MEFKNEDNFLNNNDPHQKSFEDDSLEALCYLFDIFKIRKCL